MRGSCKYRIRDFEGAIQDFNKEIEFSPNHVMGYVNRALAYGELKQYRPAINDLDIAIGIDPMWSQSYIYRGVFYNLINVKDSSCGDFRMAFKLNNPQAEAYSKQYCK
jgi:tetratricopeptide (TPR) repeat protein